MNINSILPALFPLFLLPALVFNTGLRGGDNMQFVVRTAFILSFVAGALMSLGFFDQPVLFLILGIGFGLQFGTGIFAWRATEEQLLSSRRFTRIALFTAVTSGLVGAILLSR